MAKNVKQNEPFPTILFSRNRTNFLIVKNDHDWLKIIMKFMNTREFDAEYIYLSVYDEWEALCIN